MGNGQSQFNTEDEAKEELTRRLAQAQSDQSIADAAAATAQLSQAGVENIQGVIRAHTRLGVANASAARVRQLKEDLDLEIEETRNELEESRQDLDHACMVAQAPNNNKSRTRRREEDETVTGMILLLLVP